MRYLLSLIPLCAAIVLVAAGGTAWSEPATPVVLANDTWTIRVDPRSLEMIAQPQGGPQLVVSGGQDDLGPVTGLTQTDSGASWVLSERGISVSVRLRGDALEVSFRADAPGSFTWPIVGSDPTTEAYILPLFEGSFVPADDQEWLQFLISNGPINSTEGLSMPFWGLRWRGHTLTYLLANEFNNELTFEDRAGRIGIRFSHDFTRNWTVKEYGFTIALGGGSPVEPARCFRQQLIERGGFVSLKEKAAQVPGVGKLLGAAHVWLWGDALISRYDVVNWKRFLPNLLSASRAPDPSPTRRVWDLMAEESHAQVTEAAAMEFPYRAIKDDVMNALCEVAARPDFYQEEAWRGVRLPEEARALIAQGVSKLAEAKLLRLNSLLLESAFPGEFLPSERWGNGVSLKMIDAFGENGFDRLWLGMDSWHGPFRHPQAIGRAEDLGYLIGPYDSYHSIHAPDEMDSWETAQFDRDLYERGPVVRADGTKRPGFLRKGYMLSPIAAFPYVKKRVGGIMAGLPAPLNSWFIDCDAFGELFDDYSPLHPATQQDDMEARLARMAWIRDTYKLVIGSEGGSSYAAPVIHFAHGMLTPVIGWGDPDLKEDRSSPYFLGRAWPPDAPEIHVKQVPLKPLYRKPYYDPRFRLPLYQIVFHDSVVATHHWGSASLKFSDQVDTAELLELLYNVPPLYHMNLDELEKHKDLMKAHYAFFSPLHRELGMEPMTDFAWLTPDRTVQRTVFGTKVEMVANFAEEGFEYHDTVVPGRSILARWLETGATRVYTPAPAGGA
ncbi:MAG: glycoside hydrolase [Armatimonadota bacterium]